jgi:hypothetical protein
MNDYMLLEYLRNQGVRGNEHELMDEFKHYMRARGSRSMRGVRRHRENPYDNMYEERFYNSDRPTLDMSYMDYSRNRGYMRHTSSNHFDEYEAKEIVADMCHYEGDKKIEGEKFNMRKAEEVYLKFKNMIPSDSTVEDFYIAINATYHDFYNLLKSWFGPSVEDKIFALAVTFWFQDEDYKGNKLMDYFE